MIYKQQNQYSRRKIPELLEYLSKAIEAQLKKFEISDVQAESVGIHVSNKIAEDLGGQLLYIPKGVSLRLSLRDLQIYKEYNGKNHAELSKKHGLSVQHIYKIIKLVKKDELARRQTTIFDDL
ncbi:Mor transcription activator family protein [Oligella urethralis]|uniref:Mor transcription activator family protein n=1 Tax=Oligella urethralis TaxID=90245 RepID=UPI000DFDC2DF|nr:Mor transcription activator family protein [Oligella urethralis]SUA57999.1 Uncharacterized conserved protein [Oligella urethralis]